MARRAGDHAARQALPQLVQDASVERDERDAKMRAHPGANHLRVPGIDRLRGEIDRVHSRSGGGAQQRAQIAGIAQPVEHQHQRRRVVQSGCQPREGEDRQDALRRLHVTQPVEEPGLDDARVDRCRKREVSPRFRLTLPHEQETRDGAGLQGIVDGPAPFDDKRSLGGAAVAPGEGAHQGNGGVGGGGDDVGGGGVASLRGCHDVQGGAGFASGGVASLRG